MPPPLQFADLPSSSPAAHAEVLAEQCDAVVLVADASDPAWAGKTEDLLPTVRALLRPGTRIRSGTGLEGAGAIIPRAAAEPEAAPAAGQGGEQQAQSPPAWFPVLLCMTKSDKRAPTPLHPTPDQLAAHHRCLLGRVSARTGDGVTAALHPFLYAVVRARAEQEREGGSRSGRDEGASATEGQ